MYVYLPCSDHLGAALTRIELISTYRDDSALQSNPLSLCSPRPGTGQTGRELMATLCVHQLSNQLGGWEGAGQARVQQTEQQLEGRQR